MNPRNQAGYNPYHGERQRRGGGDWRSQQSDFDYGRQSQQRYNEGYQQFGQSGGGEFDEFVGGPGGQDRSMSRQSREGDVFSDDYGYERYGSQGGPQQSYGRQQNMGYGGGSGYSQEGQFGDGGAQGFQSGGYGREGGQSWQASRGQQGSGTHGGYRQDGGQQGYYSRGQQGSYGSSSGGQSGYSGGLAGGQGNYGGQQYGSSSSGQGSYGNQQYGSTGSGMSSGQGWQGSQGSQRAGRGPKGWKRSDERIQDDICECLAFGSDVDAEEVQIKVEAGEVTLTGTVSDRWAKRRIEEMAEQINGVHDVNNQLKVKRQDQSGSSGMLGSSSGGSGSSSSGSGSITAGSIASGGQSGRSDSERAGKGSGESTGHSGSRSSTSSRSAWPIEHNLTWFSPRGSRGPRLVEARALF